MSPDLDPAAHRLVPPRFFEDLVVGERYHLPSRTVTDAHFSAFQAVSGDNHPIHYDVEYCKAQGHPGLLAHGFQVLAATAAGAGLFPHEVGAALVGLVSQSSRFLKPVYAGDTLYVTLTIAELIPQRTTGVVVLASAVSNQRSETVLEGEHRYVVKMQGRR